MSEHTPGPWEYSRNYRVYSLKHGPIADVFFKHTANTRLIAAAPETAAERDKLKAEKTDLLEALDLAAIELKAVHSYYHPDCEGGCPCELALSTADAMLAKAKGDA